MKNALVTGAGKRLGRAMSLMLAERGYNVAIHYASSEEAAEQTAQDARALGVGAATLQADLLSEDATQGLVQRAAEALGGPLSVLVNNASVFEYDTIESADKTSWDRHIGSNMRAPFVLTQQFARQAPPPAIDEMGEPVAQAVIVNMLDQRVRKLTPEFMSYTLAKMGLWAMTRTTAQALAPAIRVNAIGPGPTLIGERQSDRHFARQRRATVLQRGSNPQDIVAALAFILDAPALTGQLLCMDGGQHLGWKTPDILGLD
ncbi:SDR family oxidoreductase [Brevirhabdus sp.]|uniref:SDR family oxidoreductase n=1 Tax=Brevirhabdus sp. TaxID=2004514 RepID=UPI004058500B